MTISYYDYSKKSQIEVSDLTPLPVTGGGGGAAGGATAANQTAANASLASIDAGTVDSLGQKTSANSSSVVIASDQTAVPVNNAQLVGTAVSVNSGTADAGTQRVTIATNVNVPTNAAQVAGTAVSVNNGSADNGTQRVVIANNNTAFNVTSNSTNITPSSTSTNTILTPFLNAALGATAVVVKAAQGKLLRYRIYNPNSAVAFVQVFNAATTGAVTLGTTVPIEVFPVPAGMTMDGDQDFSFNYTAGIVIAATTTATGSTANTTPLVVNLGYV
jgi:hypothetical protein